MRGVSSSRWEKVRNQFMYECRAANRPCHICKQPIDYSAAPQTADAFEADHYYPRSTHPHLTFDPSNLRAAHSSCNRARGNSAAAPQWNRAEEW